MAQDNNMVDEESPFPVMILNDYNDNVEEEHKEEEQEEEEDDDEQGEDKAPAKDKAPVKEEKSVEADTDAVAFYNALVKNEYLEEDENFKGTWEEMDAKIAEIPQKVADAIISQAPPVTQQLLAYAMERGDKLTRKELKAFLEIEEGSDVIPSEEALEDADKAREYMKRDYMRKNSDADADEIEEYLDNLEKKNILIKRAKANADKEREGIQEQVKAKLAEEKENNVKQQQRQKQFIDDISSNIDKLGYDKKVKSGIIENLRTDVIARKNAAIMKSHKAVIQLANIYRLFNEKTGEFDLSSIEKIGESKASQKTKEALTKDAYQSAANKKATGDTDTPKSGFGASGLKLKLT